MTMLCSCPFKSDRYCDSVVYVLHFNKENTQYIGKNKTQMGDNSKLWLEKHETSDFYKT